jgi:hypothetical protein
MHRTEKKDNAANIKTDWQDTICCSPRWQLEMAEAADAGNKQDGSPGRRVWTNMSSGIS